MLAYGCIKLRHHRYSQNPNCCQDGNDRDQRSDYGQIDSSTNWTHCSERFWVCQDLRQTPCSLTQYHACTTLLYWLRATDTEEYLFCTQCSFPWTCCSCFYWAIPQEVTNVTRRENLPSPFIQKVAIAEDAFLVIMNHCSLTCFTLPPPMVQVQLECSGWVNKQCFDFRQTTGNSLRF